MSNEEEAWPGAQNYLANADARLSSEDGKYGTVLHSSGVSLDQAIEDMGVGCSQWVMIVITGLVSLADFAEISYLTFVTEVLRCEWNITHGQESFIFASVFIGALIGAPLWGYLSDKSGRRKAFLMSSALVCIFGFATAACQGLGSLLAVRFMVGFAVGGVPISFDIMAEALPHKGRGRYLLITQLFWAAGGVYVNLCGWLLLEHYGWRAFTAVCAAPALAVFVAGLLFMPESPRWLLDAGRPEEALVILNRWAEMNGRDRKFDELRPTSNTLHANFSDLFVREPLRWIFLKTLLYWPCMTSVYMAFVLLPPRVFQDAIDEGHMKCALVFRFEDLTIAASSEIAGVFIALAVIDQIGRIGSQILLCILSGGIILTIGMQSWAPYALLGLVSTGRATGMAAMCIMWVHCVEMFPTSVRSVANELAFLSGKVGSIISPFIVSKAVGLDVSGVIIAFLSVVAALIAFHLPETTNEHLDAKSAKSADADPCH